MTGLMQGFPTAYGAQYGRCARWLTTSAAGDLKAFQKTLKGGTGERGSEGIRCFRNDAQGVVCIHSRMLDLQPFKVVCIHSMTRNDAQGVDPGAEKFPTDGSSYGGPPYSAEIDKGGAEFQFLIYNVERGDPDCVTEGARCASRAREIVKSQGLARRGKEELGAGAAARAADLVAHGGQRPHVVGHQATKRESADTGPRSRDNLRGEELRGAKTAPGAFISRRRGDLAGYRPTRNPRHRG